MGRATSECVAQGLGLSVRSMQRQLDEAGASFTSLVNEVRCDLAPRYIDNPKYSLQRVSELLGYSTQGSFTRWFATQFHQVPSAWRESHAPRK
jgi:AraC-like DNA-binding protein